MSRIDELNQEIEKLSAKLSKSKYQAERALLNDKINAAKAEIKMLNTTVKAKEIRTQKEAPDRLDHVDSKVGRGSITNTGDTFLGIL